MYVICYYMLCMQMLCVISSLVCTVVICKNMVVKVADCCGYGRWLTLHLLKIAACLWQLATDMWSSGILMPASQRSSHILPNMLFAWFIGLFGWFY